MTIALVTPSPIPFVIGGAEKFFEGMFHTFMTKTSHRFELIKLPCKDDDFFSLMACYRRFMELDLTHFDRVIATKYPAWMIRHPHKIVYMQHPSRGVYDLYEGEEAYENLLDDHLAPLGDILQKRAYSYEEAGRLIEAALACQGHPALAFPGPLTRAVIHYLDRTALNHAQRYYAISETVASRAHYFPNVPVEVLHHPSSLPYFETKGYDYLFTASRLENLKRIDLLIEAYKKVKSDLPFYIAGTGGQEARLKALAAEDPRIRFLGFVSDEDLIRHYGRALFVPFVPFNEDYGLITIEAMNSKKAVLTAQDSGGVAELVQEGVNGKVVEPTPEAIAAAMQELVDDPAKTRQMGQRAYESVRHITWDRLVQRLTDSRQENLYFAPSAKHPVAILSTFPVSAPVSGGQNRIFYLYKHLAARTDTPLHILSLTHAGAPLRTHQIAPGLYETQIPKSADFEEKESFAPISATDILFCDLHHTVPLYEQTLRALEPKAVILEQPYTVCLARNMGLPVVYNAHNVEILLKEAMLGSHDLLDNVRRTEKEALSLADLVTAVSDEDARQLQRLYGYQGEIAVIPNGVDGASIQPMDTQQIRTEYGLTGKIALFMGSYHQPNVEAVEAMVGLARRTPTVNYIVLGSVADAFIGRTMPDNLAFAGVVDERVKRKFLAVADIALNPITSGGGSNLKIIEYLAAGVPVVTTELGARGFPGIEKFVAIRPLAAFAQAIEEGYPFESAKARAFAAEYDFARLAKRLHALLKKEKIVD